MSIEAISPIGMDIVGADRTMQVRAPAADFADMIGESLGRIDQSLRAADGQIRSLAAGENIPLHEVMISMEQARMDLMLAVEVRNRLVESYQELTRMQL